MNLKDVADWERGRIVIEELLRMGVGYFVFTSGAQSSPLIHALLTIHAMAKRDQRHQENSSRKRPLIAFSSHLDERGASYHALGYAKATGKPAAIILTSGTALANAMPAAVEAHKSELPLLILSADRPPELQNVRSNQTITQDHFFGRFAVFSATLPLLAEPFDLKALLAIMHEGWTHFSNGCQSARGVVHFNIPFRKPLIAEWSPVFHETLTPQTLAHLSRGILKEKSSNEKLASHHSSVVPSATETTAKTSSDNGLNASEENALAAIVKNLLASKHRGRKILMISGLSDGISYTEKTRIRHLIQTISHYLTAPVFMDIASPLMLGTPISPESAFTGSHGYVIENFPLILGAYIDAQRQGLRNDLHFPTILHLGSEVVNDALIRGLQQSPPDEYFHIERMHAHYDPGCILPPHRPCRTQKITAPLLAALAYMVSSLEKAVLKDHPALTQASSETSTQAPSEDLAAPNHIPVAPATPSTPSAMPATKLSSPQSDLPQTVHQHLMKLNRNLRAWIKDYHFKAFSELEIVRTIMQVSLEACSQERRGQRSRSSASSKSAHPEWSLFLGNSMPVRSFALVPMAHGFVNIFTARGTSGIDGLLALATGISLGTLETSGSSRVMAILGDLSLLHDLNSLLFLTQNKEMIIGLVVINNHEGTIFNHLPIKPYMKSHWDEFVFKHELNFKSIAEMAAIDYTQLSDAASLRPFLETVFHSKKSFLLELTLASDANFAEHQDFVRQAQAFIAKHS